MAKAYLEPGEVELLEGQALFLRDRLLVRLLFHTGCRVSEAVSLGVEDVDPEAGTVRILHLKERLHLSCPHCGIRLGRGYRFCPGCGKEVGEAMRRLQETRRQRVLPLDLGTAQMLRDYISRGGPVEKGGRRLLFGINRHRAWQIVRDLALKADLPRLVNPETGRVHGVSPHRLRDAFATHAVKIDDSGDGLRLLQEHLGHVSFNTTARYRKVAGEEHREWYQRLWTKHP